VKSLLKHAWHDDEGVLTFEWILLVTLLTIGIVSGLTAVRDALIDELSDVAGAAVAIDQSFSLAPDPCFGVGGIGFVDPATTVTTCTRQNVTPDQPAAPNCDFPAPGP
jgi:Flp pilus assembly pilin Flp